MLSDLRFALRSLRKSPGFAAVAILSLALGIGANTAIFSLVNEVLLTALPVRDPGQLVLFNWSAPPDVSPQSINGWTQRDPVTKETTSTSFSLATFAAFRAAPAPLSDVFAFAPLDQLNVILGGQAQVVRDSQVVSGNYFSAIGVPLAAGRALTPADDLPAAPPVAVISHRFWLKNFAGSPAALNSIMTVNHVPVTIVGVTAPQFAGTGQAGEVQDLSLPLALYGQLAPDDTDAPQVWSFWVRIMGRLKPGATLGQAQVSLAPVFTASIKGALDDPKQSPEALHLHARSGAQGLVEARRGYAQSLRVLLVLVGLVLLVACANVANLLLARGAARRREIAVRLALGASRPRLLRQLLGESVLLALLGAALGLLLALWSRDAVLALQPLGAQGLNLGMPLDWRVLAFTTAVAVGTGILFGLAPAWRATGLNPGTEFQGGTRTIGGARSRLAKSLMVLQVALSLVLLIGAGLFTRTLRNLQHINPGFNSSGLLLFRVDAMSAGRPREALPELYGRLTDRFAALPGVAHATFSQMPLLARSSWTSIVTLRDEPEPTGNNATVTMNGVENSFFSTYQLPLLLGRGFNARDAAKSPRVAVVNEAFARKFYGDRPAPGHFIGFNGTKDVDIEIVGVVADAKYVSLQDPPRPAAFFPFAQTRNARFANFALRVAGDPLALAPAVRTALHEVDAALPLYNLRTQDEQIARLLTGERLFARLSAFFGLLAMILAAIGLYGLMSYSVLQRTGEIGLRMALGALPAGLLRMIILETLRLVALGVVLGAASAWALSRLVRSQLYGLTPTDPATYAAMIFLLLAVGVLAAWLPARRAARVDPMTALRNE